MTRTLVFFCLAAAAVGHAYDPAYTRISYEPPEGLKLEVSGIAVLPAGEIAVSIRKGEVWILERPDADPRDPLAIGYRRFASALHEPMGLWWHDGDLYVVQRTELTRLRDTNGDGVADEYACIAKGWGVSGHYHEYAYGPVRDSKGRFWLALNARLGVRGRDPQAAASNPWRGWVMRTTQDGELGPVVGGLRSPSGLGLNASGDLFATDQQGEWWPTNALVHLREGVFFGHQDWMADSSRPESPLPHPGVLPEDITVAEAYRLTPGFVPPAVWFPYVKMGQSPTGVAYDPSGGGFGPFPGQLFVGEFVLSSLSRVYLEQVGGEYQGAVFPFLGELQCGAVRLEFMPDGSLLVGQTNRGWNSQGPRSYGLERIRWTGRVPFEIHRMEARADGFFLAFTQEVDPVLAADPRSYELSSYTYLYHRKYGSPEVDARDENILRIELAPDRKGVRIFCHDLRPGYVYELHVPGLKTPSGATPINPRAYYTLNRVPGINP